MSNDGDVTYDMCTRIGKASSVFRRLRPIWRSSTISKNTKLCLYTSVVIPTAIYAGETWKTTEKTRRMLDVFNRRCLRNILGISWKDHLTNADLLHRKGMMNLQDIVADRRRFIGHILDYHRPGRQAQHCSGSQKGEINVKADPRKHGKTHYERTLG